MEVTARPRHLQLISIDITGAMLLNHTAGLSEICLQSMTFCQQADTLSFGNPCKRYSSNTALVVPQNSRNTTLKFRTVKVIVSKKFLYLRIFRDNPRMATSMTLFLACVNSTSGGDVVRFGVRGYQWLCKNLFQRDCPPHLKCWVGIIPQHAGKANPLV